MNIERDGTSTAAAGSGLAQLETQEPTGNGKPRPNRRWVAGSCGGRCLVALECRCRGMAPSALNPVQVLPLILSFHCRVTARKPHRRSGAAVSCRRHDGFSDYHLGTDRIPARISRTSTMHYRDSSKALPEIARELGVDAVVEGLRRALLATGSHRCPADPGTPPIVICGPEL